MNVPVARAAKSNRPRIEQAILVEHSALGLPGPLKRTRNDVMNLAVGVLWAMRTM